MPRYHAIDAAGQKVNESHKSGAATLNEVARLAGVSIKTISRVINGESGVSEKTRAGVLRAIAILDYRPNLSARALRSGRSQIVAVLFDNPSTHYISTVQNGALRECKKRGYHLSVEMLGDASIDGASILAHLIVTLRVRGVILTPPLTDRASLLELLERHQVPYVRIAPARDPDRAPRVLTDDVRGAYEMTRLLIKLGHRRIGIIKGHTEHGACHLRFEGFEAAMREGSLSIPAEYIQPGDFSFDSGTAAARRMLLLKVPPTAILASNDEMAIGALAVAEERRVAVPGELSIAGFDDTSAATMVWPQLTTVRHPIESMAASAVEILSSAGRKSEWPRSAPPIIRALNFTIVERGTTGPAPAVFEAS